MIVNTPDTYTTMLDHAKSIGVSIIRHENSIARKAKEWGHDFLVNVKLHGYTTDDLIGETKDALGWPKLIGTSGKSVKAKFNVWFSFMRRVLENWHKLDDAIQSELLAGTRSFTTEAERLQKAERDAKRDAEKAAETESAPANANSSAEQSANPLATLALYIRTMSDAEIIEQSDALADILAAIHEVEARIQPERLAA